MKQEEKLKQPLLKILKEIEDSNKIQDSSTNVMKYMIQDLLDFAQIKSGKFNQKIKQFDVQLAITEIADIQQHKAVSQGIDLQIIFEGFENDNYEVVTDKERI